MRKRVPTELLKKRINVVVGFLKEKGVKIPSYDLRNASRGLIVGVYGSLSELARKHLTVQEVKQKVKDKRDALSDMQQLESSCEAPHKD